MSEPKLVFVYNAGSDVFSTVTDFVHKIISPSTYQCSLCALTYGNLSIKQEWKTFIETLPLKTVFLHKDEFVQQYNLQIDLPAILIQLNELIKPFMTKEEINHCKDL